MPRLRSVTLSSSRSPGSSLPCPFRVPASSSLAFASRFNQERIRYGSSGSLTRTLKLADPVPNSFLPLSSFPKYFATTASTATTLSSFVSVPSRSEWLSQVHMLERRLTSMDKNPANIQDIVNIWADIRTLCDQFTYHCSNDIEQTGNSISNPSPSSSSSSSSPSSTSGMSTRTTSTTTQPAIASLHARLHLLFLNLFDTVWTAGINLYGNLLDDKEEHLLSYITSSTTGLPSSTSLHHMYSIELHSCGKEIMRNALRYGCTPDIRIFDKYIRLLGMRSATLPRELFNIIQFQGMVPNSSTYRSLLLVAARHHTPVDTLPVLLAMREHKYRPDAFILSAILGDIDKLLYGKNSNSSSTNIGDHGNETNLSFSVSDKTVVDDGRLRLVIDVALAGAEEEVAEAVDELQAAQARVNEGIAALEAVEEANKEDDTDAADKEDDDDEKGNKTFPRGKGNNHYGPGLRRKDEDEEKKEGNSDEDDNDNRPHRSGSNRNRRPTYRFSRLFPPRNFTESDMEALSEILDIVHRSQDTKDTPENKGDGSLVATKTLSPSDATGSDDSHDADEEEDDDETEEEPDTLDPVPPTLASDAERWRKLAERVLRENTNPEGLSPLEFQQKILSLRSEHSGPTDGHLANADLLPSPETQALIEKEAMRVLVENKKFNEQTRNKLSTPDTLSSSTTKINPQIVGSLSGTEWRIIVTAYKEACTIISQRRYNNLMEYANSLFEVKKNKGILSSHPWIDPRLHQSIQHLNREQKQEILQILRKRLETGLYLPANITLLPLDNPDYLESLAKHTLHNLSLSSSAAVAATVPSSSSSIVTNSSSPSSPSSLPPILRNQVLSSLLYACLAYESSKRSGEEIF